jgi:septal ring factor EnvC (AmiA/AmiB activator)
MPPRLPPEALERSSSAPGTSPSSLPPPLTAAARRGARPITSPPTVHASLPPAAAILAARLETVEAELTRVRRQMRARDAYLAELEHALEASTSKLEASGLGSVDDAHKLLGRVRGQAFRIAELEAELRHMEQRLSRLARLLPAGYIA